MKTPLVFSMFLSVLLITSCGDDDDLMMNDTNEDNDNGMSSDIEMILNAHNRYRSEVGVDDIEWSNDLANSAQQWANQLAVDCSFEHSTSPFGENLWAGTSGAFSVEDVVDSWGAEKEFYDEGANQCIGGDCLHYTQVVWQNSTEVGCGMITCDGLDIWVCQYNPAGNIVGERPY